MSRKARTPEEQARRDKSDTATGKQHYQYGGYPELVQGNHCRIHGE